MARRRTRRQSPPQTPSADELKLLRLVIDDAPVGILVFDGPKGECRVANRRGEEIFGRARLEGFTPDLLLGLMRRADGSAFLDEESAYHRAMTGQVVFGEEGRVRQPGDNDRPVLVSAGPLVDTSGIRGVVLLVHDISTIKDLERRRDEWIAVVAHDLLQPLTVATAYASMVEKLSDQLPVPVVDWSRQILSCTRRLSHLARDLLNQSILAAERLVLYRDTVAIGDLVKDIVERLTPVYHGHPIQVVVHDPVPAVRADPERLEQALGNLVSNAIKYGYPDTEILVSVTARQMAVEISVANRGEGLSHEDQLDLFTRFGRSRQTGESQAGGLGLGLYITKSLIEAHGGQIWVTSVPKRFTAFHFTLPI